MGDILHNRIFSADPDTDREYLLRFLSVLIIQGAWAGKGKPNEPKRRLL